MRSRRRKKGRRNGRRKEGGDGRGEFLLWDAGEDNEEKENAPSSRDEIMYCLGTEIVLGDDVAPDTTAFDSWRAGGPVAHGDRPRCRDVAGERAGAVRMQRRG